jgi:acetyl-CoA C-acetyltransferase/acetyl-CoA acyltransferase
MSDKIKAVTNFRLPYLSPVIAIEQGLTDPFCGLNMGQTAELLAREFEIDREAQDAYAVESHRKTILAGKEGKWSQEIVPLHFGRGLAQYLEKDIGPRDDSSMEKLAKLKPYFEKKSGTVTVGNSCPITDGGSMLLLCSKKAVEKYQLNPIAKMTNYHFHGLSPKRMGMGPLLAMDGVLKRSQLNLSQMDLIEINEAFAAQVLSIIKVAKDKTLCEKFGMGQVLGEINSQILNVNGGAIALGHPVGSSGSRIVVTLMHELKRRRLKKGLASLCIGGGQGGACIIEMV